MKQAKPPILAKTTASAGGAESPSRIPSAKKRTNPIPNENQKPGNPPSEWDIGGEREDMGNAGDPSIRRIAGDPSIQGFTNDISYAPGDVVRLKVNTASTDYRLDIYRMGYYGGNGARKIVTIRPSVSLPQSQPPGLTDAVTGLIDCGNWADSAHWLVPSDAVSGIYFAKLVREDVSSDGSHIIFVIRDDDRGSDLLFQTSDTTWQAYNRSGGNSLYVRADGVPPGRAYKVSYNRPFVTRTQSWVFSLEFPMVRWLEANGYDVSYSTGVDTDRMGATQLLSHRSFLSVGHDEYWSGNQRQNVEAARDAGVHLAFFSGNEVYWKTRWEDSIDGSGTPYRTLVCYKEAAAKLDPQPKVWTGTWRDVRGGPPYDGGVPENALTGQMYMVFRPEMALKVLQADGKMRFWRSTSIATLAPGETAILSDRTLGYEWDEDLDNPFRPPGVVRLSTTSVPGVTRLPVWPATSPFALGTSVHHLTLFRSASIGSLTFAAGTPQWSWGLDGTHDWFASTPDVRMQQATVNLFADMGVQPATLQAGLVAAEESTDSIPPTSTIDSPADGSYAPLRTPVVVSGTAADRGGGVVGGVEVSVDGGSTWHPANGRENWTYTWKPVSPGPVTIRSRAVDDSGNLETPSPGSTLTIKETGFIGTRKKELLTPGVGPTHRARRFIARGLRKAARMVDFS